VQSLSWLKGVKGPNQALVSLSFSKFVVVCNVIWVISLIIWLLFDSVYKYQPSEWLKRPGFYTSEVVGWLDHL